VLTAIGLFILLDTKKPGLTPWLTNGRNVRGSRTLPDLITQLPTGTPIRNKQQAQDSARTQWLQGI